MVLTISSPYVLNCSCFPEHVMFMVPESNQENRTEVFMKFFAPQRRKHVCEQLAAALALQGGKVLQFG